MRPPDELLYESEASHRLIDHALEELGMSGGALDQDSRTLLEHFISKPGGFADLSRTLLRAYAETAAIANRLRESCGIADKVGLDRLQQMHGRLREVSTATEMATWDILDGLARTVSLIEGLDVSSALSDADRHRLVGSVREELHSVMNHLQFQDITAQQLGHIASILADIRGRISQIGAVFASPEFHSAVGDAGINIPKGTFDPDATMTSTGDRQAVADEIFDVRNERKSA